MTQEEKIKEEGNDLNQIWDYTADQRVVPLANTDYCLAANERDVVMAACNDNDEDKSHRWILSEVSR